MSFISMLHSLCGMVGCRTLRVKIVSLIYFHLWPGERHPCYLLGVLCPVYRYEFDKTTKTECQALTLGDPLAACPPPPPLLIYLGLLSLEKHRPSLTTLRQCIRLWAVFSSSFQEYTLPCISASVSLAMGSWVFPSSSSPVDSRSEPALRCCWQVS